MTKGLHSYCFANKFRQVTKISTPTKTLPGKTGLFGLLGRAKAAPATVPVGTRVYAIGDIHGRLDLLDQLLSLIDEEECAPSIQQVIVFMGDYVDRGADSKGVIDRLLAGFPRFEAHFLKGNHEEAIETFLSDPNFYSVWKGYGGQDTLLSYGVRPPRFETAESLEALRQDFASVFPEEHRRFFSRLENSWALGDYYFAHAGVRPGVALEKQEPEDLFWIRDEFLLSKADFGKVVVHGHTPTVEPVTRSNRIGIDTGAYATGRLTALVLEDARRRFIST